MAARSSPLAVPFAFAVPIAFSVLTSGGCVAPQKPGAPAAAAVAAVAAVERSCEPPPADQAPILFRDEPMVPICRGVYVERATTPAERERLGRDYDEAARYVAEVFGPWRSPRPPATIFCKTDACRLFFGGATRRSRVISAGDQLEGAGYVPKEGLTIFMGRSDPAARDVLVHEMIHVELHGRAHEAFIPAWFHEGVAALIANTPECSGQLNRGVDDLRTLDTNPAWNWVTDLPGRLGPTYCQARAEVAAWIDRNGRERLVSLVDSVGKGTPFYEAYGPLLTQGTSFEDDHNLTLNNAHWESVRVAGAAYSNVLMSGFRQLSEAQKPFSFALWIKPEADAGTLVHVSLNPTGGGGWCTPFLGFDGAGRLVSQVMHGPGPQPINYTVVTAPAAIPLHKWTHVAMTWAPGSFIRLYVDGVKVGETAAAGYRAVGRNASLYVTWGSNNLQGEGCWQGALKPGGFKGSVARMGVYEVELDGAEVARLAATAP